jgi:hypothetical protein
MPATVLMYVNGIYTLELYCKRNGIEHEVSLNSFENIDMTQEEINEFIANNLALDRLELLFKT